MIIPLRIHQRAFDQIRKNGAQQACAAVIFVSNECDSLSALKIVTRLLQSENLAYKVKPVASYDDLLRAKESIDQAEISSIIMINCGGTIDLVGFLEPAPNVTVYVLDSHRPYHLSNVREHCQQVWILDDAPHAIQYPDDVEDDEEDDGSQAEEDEFDDAQFDGAAEDNAGSEEKAEEGEADEEGDQDDNEEEAEAEEDGSEADGSQDQSEHDESGSQAEEDNEADDAENESGADEESDEEAELGSQSESTKPSKSKGKGKGEQSVVKSEPGAVKRKSVAAPQPQPPQRRRLAKSNFEIALEREKRAERRRRLVEYYRGSSYGSASAQVAYSLARDLQRDSNELLWLAIVGCSEQFVLERIGTERYLAAVDALANDVLKNNPALRPRRAGDDEANPLAAMGLGDDGEASQLDDDQTAVQMSHGYIAASDEYRFMLLRHWTLYDAMLHSRYVATRLTLWRSNGEGNLKNLLAKMGVPLREARQSYTMMDVQLKRQLRAGLLKHAPAAGLQQIVYRSFVKRHGDKLDMSAADMVFSITSLLEGAGNTLPGVAVEDDEHVRERAFWRAYDALSRDNCDLLECGISEAQRLQVAIVKCGTQLLEKRAVVPIGPFRYVVLDQSADTPLFGHVAALTRLALFIMDAVMEIGANKTKPFVACAPLESQRTYLIVGVSNAHQRGSAAPRNTFGAAFREAAERTQARIRHDAFETSVMEIQRDDLMRFLELLHSGLVEFS